MNSNPVLDSKRKLKKLPHMFSKVLELPFHSNADVRVEETDDSFRFIISNHDIINDDDEVKAQTIEIYPGVLKIVVVRRTNGRDHHRDTNADHDLWRFRLPASTWPEFASVVRRGGELVIMVPKGSGLETNVVMDVYIEEDHEHVLLGGEVVRFVRVE